MPKKPIESAGFALMCEGKLLLLRTKAFFDLPKGRIEPGEKILEAACRELREETGIRSIALIREDPFIVTYRLRSGRYKRVYIFLAETSSPDVNLSDEHIGFKWVTLEKAEKLLPERFSFLPSALRSS